MPAEEPQDAGLDLDRVRAVFEESQDFTIGLEEEFGIVNPGSLELEHRFEDLYAACQDDPVLASSVAGELIDTEIEIRSGRAETFAEAIALQQDRRDRLFGVADSLGLALAAAGTHPWANYLDQQIIDTPHYRRLQADLGWVAQRNNTWSMHVHVGVNGPDRAIAVCDWMREILPPLLALSANSPFLDRRDTGLHSVRTEIFTRTFPRCGIPEPFVSWSQYADFVDLLGSTGSIVESTQLWWSIRPHHRFGTVEVRICDAQSRGDESFALAGLMIACVAQTAMEYDRHGYSGVGEPLRDREIEENLWRAIRHGMDGEMIDFRGRRLVPTRQVVEELLQWTEPARGALGIEIELPPANGAQRRRRQLEDGAPIEEIYRASIEETRATYTPEKAAVVKDSTSDG